MVTPLAPTTGVGNRTFFFHTGGAGQNEDLGFDILGVHPGASPKFGCFILKKVDVDHPVQLGHSLTGLIGVGSGASRVLAPGKKALEVPFVHFIKEVQPGVSFAVVQFRHPGVAKIIGLGSSLSEHGLEEAHRVLGSVLPPVGTDGIIGLGSPLLIISPQ